MGIIIKKLLTCLIIRDEKCSYCAMTSFVSLTIKIVPDVCESKSQGCLRCRRSSERRKEDSESSWLNPGFRTRSIKCLHSATRGRAPHPLLMYLNYITPFSSLPSRQTQDMLVPTKPLVHSASKLQEECTHDNVPWYAYVPGTSFQLRDNASGGICKGTS